MGIFSALTGRAAAPSVTGSAWFNIDELPAAAAERVAAGQSLRLGSDVNQLTVVNFWNYECIECGELIPTLRRWWQELKPQGLFIIGVHSPTYEAETSTDNVESAVLRFGMTYPVVSDPELANWRSWHASARPQLFLVSPEGKIRKRLGAMSKLSQFEALLRAQLRHNASSNQ